MMLFSMFPVEIVHVRVIIRAMRMIHMHSILLTKRLPLLSINVPFVKPRVAITTIRVAITTVM